MRTMGPLRLDIAGQFFLKCIVCTVDLCVKSKMGYHCHMSCGIVYNKCMLCESCVALAGKTQKPGHTMLTVGSGYDMWRCHLQIRPYKKPFFWNPGSRCVLALTKMKERGQNSRPAVYGQRHHYSAPLCKASTGRWESFASLALTKS